MTEIEGFGDNWSVEYNKGTDSIRLTLFHENHFVDELYIDWKTFLDIIDKQEETV